MSGDKKYQVFISSTYEDLKSERKAVEETIIRAGDIPVGMEAFPAVDSEQFEFIKTVIRSCDYYVLIIAGPYGSLADDGLSYTEKEFRYAVECGIPALVFVRDEIGSISADKSEPNGNGRKKLGEFVKFASNGRMRKPWSTVEGLKLSVRESLDHSKATSPRFGWVRGDSVASKQALMRLEELRNENNYLKVKIGQTISMLEIPELPDIDSEMELLFESRGYGGLNVKIKSTFRKMLAPFLLSISEKTSDYDGSNYYWIDEDEIRDSFTERIAHSSANSWKLSGDSFKLLNSYFLEAEILTEGGEKPILGELGRKFSRRLFINNSGKSWSFEIVSGSFEIKSDDEIPF